MRSRMLLRASLSTCCPIAGLTLLVILQIRFLISLARRTCIRCLYGYAASASTSTASRKRKRKAGCLLKWNPLREATPRNKEHDKSLTECLALDLLLALAMPEQELVILSTYHELVICHHLMFPARFGILWVRLGDNSVGRHENFTLPNLRGLLFPSSGIL